MSDATLPRFYHHLAAWWPLLSSVAEYAEEAEFYSRVLLEAGDDPARSLLEIGSGGGNNAAFMKRHFEPVTLVDPAPAMLAHSRRINPECDHLEGDMRTLRLDREFDRVFIHDAIVYMTTEADLRAALETAFVHCRRGGAALFAPDYVKENFRPDTDHGGGDDGERRMRFLEWVYDPDPADTNYVVEYAFLMNDGRGETRIEHDRHVEGLFSRNVWLRLLERVGFQATVRPLEHSELEPGAHEVFIGVKL